MEYVTLANGVKMPKLGLGMISFKTQETMNVGVKAALDYGYTSFDEAYRYYNEKEFGNAWQDLSVKRSDIFITTKSRMLRHAYDDAIDTVYSQLKTFQTNYFDLYLIHWPTPSKPALYVQAWRALEKLYRDGVIRAIGVSNFFEEQLDVLLAECEIKPMVNQIQIHPYYVNQSVFERCAKEGIAMEAWQPLGAGEVLKDEKIAAIAQKHGKSPAQVILRWHMQKNIIAIPGATKPHHIKECIEIFDFELSAEEMKVIKGLECGRGVMPRGRVYDPANFPMMW